jgi:hypothetical protein
MTLVDKPAAADSHPEQLGLGLVWVNPKFVGQLLFHA